MADLNGFDARTVEPDAGFNPIPAGKYDVIITASEKKQTAAGDGSYLKLEFQVISGQHQNRKLWTNLNLDNKNAQAVQIARAQLSAICRAVNVPTPKDSSELHNKPLVAKVVVRKSEEYGDQNDLKGFEPRPQTPLFDAQAPPAQQPAPAAANPGRPW